jgi:K+-transporting ATPase KdpF subunit
MLVFDHILGGLMATLLLAYLIYALLRPERFRGVAETKVL